MTSISFVLRSPEAGGPRGCVMPILDGRTLRALAEEFEKSQGFDVAGGYDGIAHEFFGSGPILEYFLGSHDRGYWRRRNQIAVLGCNCLEVECWPLLARVDVLEKTIEWSSFVQPHRQARDYSGFGPFRFDRRTYESALAALAVDIARLQN